MPDRRITIDEAPPFQVEESSQTNDDAELPEESPHTNDDDAEPPRAEESPHTETQPLPKGIHCEGCEDFSCTKGMWEWTAVVGEEAATVMQSKIDDMEKARHRAVVAANDACTLWLRRHGCFYHRLSCFHSDGSVASYEVRTEQNVTKFRCSDRNCRNAVELTAPLPITKKMMAYKVMVAFLFFVKGRHRTDAHAATGIRYGTVCELFSGFEKIFATEEFAYGATLNRLIAQDEIEELSSGVRPANRQHVQADETTWGGAKYGRGKPTHGGSTQWFQTMCQVVKIKGGEVIKSFAVFPVADRTRLTLAANIYSVVPRGAKIRTDCFRSYVGLGKDYEHYTVNHSVGFTTPSKVHTNHIESLHSRLKSEVKKRRNKLPVGEGRIYAVMACSAMYRCGRVSRDTFDTIDERTSTASGESRVACAFKILRWMAQEGVDVWKPSPAQLAEIPEANISLCVEADKVYAVVLAKTNDVRNRPAPRTAGEIRRYELDFAAAIADGPTAQRVGYHPDTRQSTPKRARRETPSAPTPLRDTSACPDDASPGAVAPRKSRGRPRKAESESPAELPCSIEEWNALDESQYKLARERMERLRAQMEQSENNWVLSRSRTNETQAADAENTEATQPAHL